MGNCTGARPLLDEAISPQRQPDHRFGRAQTLELLDFQFSADSGRVLAGAAADAGIGAG
jgi:hypothetical protein